MVFELNWFANIRERCSACGVLLYRLFSISDDYCMGIGEAGV